MTVQVDSLRHDSELQFLHELLTIFATGRLDEYLSFQARHGAEMEAIGIDNESSLETMRLLTLASLATDRDTVHYDEIAAALQVRVVAIVVVFGVDPQADGNNPRSDDLPF